MRPLRPFLALGAATIALAASPTAARADGFDARLYRPSSDAYGIGTLDGARAPDAGAILPSIATDVDVAPVVLDHGAAHDDVVSARWVLEPQLSFGLGSQFGIFARAPIIAADSGRDVYGRTLPTSGVLPPSLGVLLPLARNPLNDGRVSLRFEIAPPLGTMEEFRGDGQPTARGAFTASGRFGRSSLLTYAGGQLAPVRGVGDARIGRAITGGFAVRHPIRPALDLFGSVEARFDVDVIDQSSALAGLGVELHAARSIFRIMGSAGIHDVIGTPRAMISLAWSFDPSPAPRPPAPPPSEPAPNTAPTNATAGARPSRGAL